MSGIVVAGVFKFQSTLSHGERQSNLPFYQLLYHISIHSLAWRKTIGRLKNDNYGFKFQSTLSHGERLDILNGASVACIISIHSLAWRKTINDGRIERKDKFQSTLSHGERQLKQLLDIFLFEFQSTLSHGERHLLYV